MKVFLLVLAFALTGCSSVPDHSERINVDFKGAIYNGVANQYVRQMTWAKIYSNEDGKGIELIEVRVDRYGSGSNFLYIDKENIDRHIAAVDKYLEWEEIAKSKRNMVDKKIDEIPSKYLGYDIEYALFSGNKNNHYLSVDNGTGLTAKGVYAIFFDRNNAIKYRDMLIRFKEGKYKLSRSHYN